MRFWLEKVICKISWRLVGQKGYFGGSREDVNDTNRADHSQGVAEEKC